MAAPTTAAEAQDDQPEEQDTPVAVLLPPPSEARDPEEGEACGTPGKNTQCNGFGTIHMDDRRHIRGDPISLTTQVTLETTYADQGARYVLFSVRHITDGPREESPILLRLDRFGTSDAPLEPMREDHHRNEVNLWFNVLDLPTDAPISIDLTVAAVEAGAFSVETLVMPFDRGYAPLHDGDGNEISLYAYTFVGVNEPTGAVFEGTKGPIAQLTPGPGLPFLIAALGLTAGLKRRWSL